MLAGDFFAKNNTILFTTLDPCNYFLLPKLKKRQKRFAAVEEINSKSKNYLMFITKRSKIKRSYEMSVSEGNHFYEYKMDKYIDTVKKNSKFTFSCQQTSKTGTKFPSKTNNLESM